MLNGLVVSDTSQRVKAERCGISRGSLTTNSNRAARSLAILTPEHHAPTLSLRDLAIHHALPGAGRRPDGEPHPGVQRRIIPVLRRRRRSHHVSAGRCPPTHRSQSSVCLCRNDGVVDLLMGETLIVTWVCFRLTGGHKLCCCVDGSSCNLF